MNLVNHDDKAFLFPSEDEILAFVAVSKSKSAILNCIDALTRQRAMTLDDWTRCCKVGGAYWMETEKLRAALETIAKKKFVSNKGMSKLYILQLSIWFSHLS